MRLTLNQEGRRESATGALLFRPPDLFRLDVRGPLFQHILSAVIEGDTLTAQAGGRRVRMPARDGLDRFLDVDLGGYDPRWALLGLVAPTRIGDGEVVYPRADRAVITVPQGEVAGQCRRLWLDLRRGFVDREEVVDSADRVLWSRQLSGHRRLPGTDLYLPTRVLVAGRAGGLELEFREVRVDRGLPLEAFYGGLIP